MLSYEEGIIYMSFQHDSYNIIRMLWRHTKEHGWPKIYTILDYEMGLPVFADLTEGLVAHYPFNGNANDESGNGNDGIVSGNLQPTADRFGTPDHAYYFNGTDSYVNIGDLDLPGNFSASIWIKNESAFSLKEVVLDKQGRFIIFQCCICRFKIINSILFSI